MSLRFTQGTDQVTRANPPSVSGGFTITAWARVRVDRNDYQTLARVSVGGSTVATWATESDGLAGPNYFTGGGSIANATGFVVDAWRKVAISCTGTAGKSYVQVPGGSTEVDSGTVSSSSSPDLLTLGGRGAGDATEWFNGTLAYVRVFASELTQAQIEAEWDSTAPVVAAWAHWPLATDLLDTSGNARHLTAGSTAGGFEDDPPLGITGAVAGSMASPTGALVGAVVEAGVLAGSVAVPTGSLAAGVADRGVIAGSAPGAVGSLAAGVSTPAVLAGALAQPVGTLAGGVSTAGVLAGSLAVPVGTLKQDPPPAPSTAAWSAGPAVLAGTVTAAQPVLAGQWSAGQYQLTEA